MSRIAHRTCPASSACLACRLSRSSVQLWMPSSGSLTTDSDTVGEWLALLPPRVRGAHQSGREARQPDRCEMGDDTKYAAVWPETAARLSQPGWLNDTSHFLTAVRCSGGAAACGPPPVSTFALPSPLHVDVNALGGGSRLPQIRLTIMDLFVHVAPLSTRTRLCSRLLCVRPAAVTFRMELFTLMGLCLALKSITLR